MSEINFLNVFNQESFGPIPCDCEQGKNQFLYVHTDEVMDIVYDVVEHSNEAFIKVEKNFPLFKLWNE